MVSSGQLPLDIPSVSAYLDEVKSAFADDSVNYRKLLGCFLEWVSLNSSGFSTPAVSLPRIIEIAELLMYKPKLLHGFNALLQDGQRLVCCSSADVEEVEYLVFKTPENAWILSTAWHRDVPGPATNTELRSILTFDYDPKELLELDATDQYLCCLAQLMQFELDEQEALNSRYTDIVTRCLYSLAKKCYIPPSLILHNVTLEDQDALYGGGFADIYSGRIPGVRLCVKALRMFQQDSDYKRRKIHSKFSREVLIWRQLDHPNVLPFFGASTTTVGRRFCLISPWMSNGNIMQYLERHPDHDRLQSLLDIIEGITYLHSLATPVIHKDIKGANVLVTDAGVCCIADFGLSSIKQSQASNTSTGAIEGSVYWLAPEAMDFVPGSNPKESTKVDIFAFGCTIYEIYSGNPPFSEYMVPFSVMLAVHDGKRAPLPPDVKDNRTDLDGLWKLVDHCWKQDPVDRPKAREVRQHIFGIMESLGSDVKMHSLCSTSLSTVDYEHRGQKSRREARDRLASELSQLDGIELSPVTSCVTWDPQVEITPTMTPRQLPTPASTPVDYKLNNKRTLPPCRPNLPNRQLPTPADTPDQFLPFTTALKTEKPTEERRTRSLNPRAPSFVPSFVVQSKTRSASAPFTWEHSSVASSSSQNSMIILNSSFASLAVRKKYTTEYKDRMVLDDDAKQNACAGITFNNQPYLSPPATPPNAPKMLKRQTSILRADASPFVPSFLGAARAAA